MEILNANSLYKIKTVGLFAQHYEEFGMSGIRKFVLYKLILKCHDAFYELKVEASEGHLMAAFAPSKIKDIESFIKEHKKKSFEILAPSSNDVERNLTQHSNKLEGAGFVYNCDEQQFEMLDERYYHLVKYVV